jgi:hypothetical protein
MASLRTLWFSSEVVINDDGYSPGLEITPLSKNRYTREIENLSSAIRPAVELGVATMGLILGTILFVGLGLAIGPLSRLTNSPRLIDTQFVLIAVGIAMGILAVYYRVQIAMDCLRMFEVNASAFAVKYATHHVTVTVNRPWFLWFVWPIKRFRATVVVQPPDTEILNQVAPVEVIPVAQMLMNRRSRVSISIQIPMRRGSVASSVAKSPQSHVRRFPATRASVSAIEFDVDEVRFFEQSRLSLPSISYEPGSYSLISITPQSNAVTS